MRPDESRQVRDHLVVTLAHPIWTSYSLAMVSACLRRSELSIEGVDGEGQVVVSGELQVTSLDDAKDCTAVDAARGELVVTSLDDAHDRTAIAAARIEVVGQGESSFSPWFATELWSLVGHIAHVFPPSVREVHVTPKCSRLLARSGGRIVWI